MADIVQDDDVEAGLPLNEVSGKKDNVGKVALLGVALVAIGLIVVGLIYWTSGDDNAAAAPNPELDLGVKNNQPMNFDADKEKLALVAETEAEPASDVASSDENVLPAVDTAAAPAAASAANNPADDIRNRRLGGDVLVSLDQNRLGGGSAGGNETVTVSGTETSTGLFGGGNRSEGTSFGSRLQPTVTAGVAAERRGDTTFLLAKGTNIQCALETRIITTQPGFTRCQTVQDIYSADGKVLLLERGSKIIGEQTAALVQGQARVFALWNEVETPVGVKVSLASPGSGALGEGGHAAKVNYHFWQRFGGAIMISLISDLSDNLSNRQKSTNGNNNTITYENSSEAAQQMATEALRNSINIPPTGTVNQGSLINIMVARDVDFRSVYEVVRVPLY
ncbi:type IV secretion system protein VirB10 [Paralysiella testudinis]|uniref:Type IV secretion system protein VirB10 n=2 Tax=Paralysiella testudinis TaxID=2809020 RepID=A0A892ZR92_9NEIS|nr:type IV secretion system protein VirB10 [Paralysiella testudinis]